MDVVGPGGELALVGRVGDELFGDLANSRVGGNRDVDVLCGAAGVSSWNMSASAAGRVPSSGAMSCRWVMISPSNGPTAKLVGSVQVSGLGPAEKVMVTNSPACSTAPECSMPPGTQSP